MLKPSSVDPIPYNQFSYSAKFGIPLTHIFELKSQLAINKPYQNSSTKAIAQIPTPFI